MKKFGIALITVSFCLALIAFSMDVVVGTTYNIGLLNERQNITYISGVIFLAGIILFGFGVVAREDSTNIKRFSICCISLPVILLVGITIKSVTAEHQRLEAKREALQAEEKIIKVEEKRERIRLALAEEKKQEEIRQQNENLKIDNQYGTHTAGNLVWQKCAVGQSWDGITCVGEAKEFTWNEAMELKSNFAGRTDWRLPTKDELMRLVYCSDGLYDSYDGECENSRYVTIPTIDTNYFPNAPGNLFWSSSAEAYGSGKWAISFSYGRGDHYYNVNDSNYVRLVRDGQ